MNLGRWSLSQQRDRHVNTLYVYTSSRPEDCLHCESPRGLNAMPRRNPRRSSAPRFKTVFLRTYPRYRFGQWEQVCEHFRSAPQQLAFDF